MRMVSAQDSMAWETQGAVTDRTQERLGVGDEGIILFRKMLKEQIENVQGVLSQSAWSEILRKIKSSNSMLLFSASGLITCWTPDRSFRIPKARECANANFSCSPNSRTSAFVSREVDPKRPFRLIRGSFSALLILKVTSKYLIPYITY
jgi:hypothetical protein